MDKAQASCSEEPPDKDRFSGDRVSKTFLNILIVISKLPINDFTKSWLLAGKKIISKNKSLENKINSEIKKSYNEFEQNFVKDTKPIETPNKEINEYIKSKNMDKDEMTKLYVNIDYRKLKTKLKLNEKEVNPRDLNKPERIGYEVDVRTGHLKLIRAPKNFVGYLKELCIVGEYINPMG